MGIGMGMSMSMSMSTKPGLAWNTFLDASSSWTSPRQDS
jgi:hypothetical protein